MSNENLNNDGNIEETNIEETKKENIVKKTINKVGKFVKGHKPKTSHVLIVGATMVATAVGIKLADKYLDELGAVDEFDDEPIEATLVEETTIEPEVKEGSEE